MQISFTKMQGCGNDYVYIDCRGNKELEDYAADTERVRRLADRHFGVGGDGVILICDLGRQSCARRRGKAAAAAERADCRMRIFNADGGEAEMCGNGVRCVAAFVGGERVTVETRAGIKTVTKDGELFGVDMGAAVVSGGEVNIGNPHRVFFVENLDGIDINDLSRGMEECNVEFAEIESPQVLKMRVHERGSGETLACGTGACAAAVMAAVRGLVDGALPVTVQMRGGEVTVKLGGGLFGSPLSKESRPRLGVLQQDHVPCPPQAGSCVSCVKAPKGSEGDFCVTLTGGAEVVFTGVVDA